jgi:replicative DNA helicase
MGKTAYMLTRVRNLAKDGIASLVFSLEMPRQELVGRLIVMESGVPNTRMAKPKSLTAQDMDAITQAAERVASWPVYIYDQASASITSIRAIGRRMKRDKDIAAVFIDYVQLASGERERGGNREQEVSSITRGLKAMAKDLSVPVIALSQLSRAVEARPDKRPQLSDLRESGSIEQDADVVQFLFRPEYYKIMEDEDGRSTEGLVEVITAKNRSGATGSTMCSWKPWLGLFEDEQDQTFAPALPAYSLNGIERPGTDDDLPF